MSGESFKSRTIHPKSMLVFTPHGPLHVDSQTVQTQVAVGYWADAFTALNLLEDFLQLAGGICSHSATRDVVRSGLVQSPYRPAFVDGGVHLLIKIQFIL